jgi:hypothetical protein
MTSEELATLTTFHRYAMNGIRRDAKRGKVVLVVGAHGRFEQFTQYLRERGTNFSLRPYGIIGIRKGKVVFAWRPDHHRGLSPDVVVTLPEARGDRALAFAVAPLMGNSEVISL